MLLLIFHYLQLKLSNLQQRILIAAIGIPIMLWIIFNSSLLFGILVIIINIIAINEFLKMFDSDSISFNNSILYIISTFFLINISNLNFEFAFYSLLLLVLILLILFLRSSETINNSLIKIFSISYISVPLSSFIILNNEMFLKDRLEIEPSNLIFSIFASVWICDSMAFFGGKFFGRRKLAPSISPKKTIEGAISGALGAFIFSIIYFYYQIQDIKLGLILGFSAGVLGQLGDLVESKLKRSADIKDSSNLIPGHGGLLDRIDSLLFATPAVLVLIKIIY
jgi:phosphatidate cytidylyltransferase